MISQLHLKAVSLHPLKVIIPQVSKSLQRLYMLCKHGVLFRRFRLYGCNKSQSTNLSKITAEFIKALSSMVRIFGAKFCISLGILS